MNMELARQVLEVELRPATWFVNAAPSPTSPMDLLAAPDAPPTDFVAFLAQRSGLSPEAAQHRLERWFGEYHATSHQRPAHASLLHAVRAPALTL